MADDIDIEEHDVLDNPKLQNIFPLITKIKKEVVDYEEDDSEYEDMYTDPNQRIKTEPDEYENRDLTAIHRNVIILGSKPSTPQPSIDITATSNSGSLDYQNEPVILPCSVVLEDWQTLLSNNPCYCPKCRILFPTVNAIDFHRMSAHSFLVAVSNNKAIKSTSKCSLVEHNPIKDNLKKIELLCQHCNVYYPDEIALIKHKYSLIPHTSKVCKEVEANEETIKSNEMTHSVEEKLYMICTMCSCVFKKEESFIGHASLNHGNPRLEKNKGPFNPKCTHCEKSISLPLNYNCHIRFSHPDLYLMKEDCGNQHQCHLCKLNFPTAVAERFHRATKHPINMKAYNTKARRALECTNRFDKRVVAVLKKTVKNFDLKPIHKAPQVNSKNVNVNTLIPKSLLYKCNKCQIHFISCTVAIEHSRHCSLSKGDWKCQSCRRSFKLDDRKIHTLQHALNIRIKVIKISEAMLPRVLNRCDNCNICFDERTFANHHANGCRPSQSVECGVCHLLIHEFTVPKHLKHHRELGLTVNDFIISDFCTIDKSTIDKHSPPKSVAASQRRAPFTVKKTLYYCPNCKCYVSRNRQRDGHDIGLCRKRGGKEVCKLCGLQFTKKAIRSHKMYHKNYALQLSDMTFCNIVTGKKMMPPFPDFKLCTVCQVYFFSGVALKNHACNSQEHKSCKHCNQKFSDLALKLHLPFHQYSNSYPAVTGSKISISAPVKKYTKAIAKKRPESLPKTATPSDETVTKPIVDLMEKYESLVTIWNILYRCQTCDIVLDTYSDVVEHCQDHFCNMENYNTKITYCKICKLKFVSKCYSRHNDLHLESNINVESFIIIDYNYNNLLFDDWLKIFDQLSKHQVQQILSKSIYNEIRGVRMKLVCDGTLGSIYRCSLCKYTIDIQSVVDHVRNKECESIVKNVCTICDIAFQFKNSAVSHENTHKISDEPFKIISFNEAKDAFINEALIKHTKADDLKFVRCQYCGKLIGKSLYRNHIYKHKYRQKINLLHDKPQKATKLAVAKTTKSEQKIIYQFYLCGSCEVAMSWQTVNRHACCPESQKLKCKKCNLFFRASNFWKHTRTHAMYPRLSRKTISITYLGTDEDKNKEIAQTPTSENITSDEVAREESGNTSVNKLKFYECILCKTCISYKRINYHSCVPSKFRTKCPKCGIYVHSSHFNHHKSLHARYIFNGKSIKIIKFNKNGKSKHPKADKNVVVTEHKNVEKFKMVVQELEKWYCGDQDANSDFLIDQKYHYMRVFKCTSCNLLFVSRHNLLDHVMECKNGCHSEKGTNCEICNLNFHSSNINMHKTVQKCDRINLSVITICTLILKGSDTQSVFNWLYYCKQCDFYSLDPMRHHMATQHKSVLRQKLCRKCDVNFSTYCFVKHRFQHIERRISFTDLNVEVLENYTLEEAGYVLQRLDNTNSTQVSGNNEHLDIETSKVGQLYRCPTCNLHFLNRSSAYSHQYKNQHHVKHAICKKCDLPMSMTSLRVHREMHKSFKSFKVIDATVNPRMYRTKLKKMKKNTSRAISSNDIQVPMSSNSDTFGSENIDDVAAESHTSRINEDESVNSNYDTDSTVKIKQSSSTVSVDEQQTVEDTCHSNTTDENKQSNINANRFSSGDVREITGSKLNTRSETKQTMHLNSQSVSTAPIKLFKCSDCDVYFLTADSCQDHTYNHEPLDPTEYIACKICDLQFLCESLGRHMKGHREKTFNLDELVVDEYQPCGMNVTIDTYSASDRLKSKLVSTTTHSDND